MMQTQLIDTGEPRCPLGCEAKPRRVGRGFVCSEPTCRLEWSTLVPGASDPISAKRNPSGANARASVTHSQAFRDDRPPTRRDDPRE
jgi:hypothetical protein